MAKAGFTLESVTSCFLPLKTFNHLPTLLDTFLNNYVLNNWNTDSILVCPVAELNTKHLPTIDYCQFEPGSSYCISLYWEDIDLVISIAFTKLNKQEDAKLDLEPTFSLKEYV